MNAEDVTLPELSDARIGELEDAVFDRIARERAEIQTAQRGRGARRRRWWTVAGAAAAVVVVAAVISPAVTGLVSPASDASSVQSAVEPDLGRQDAAGDAALPDASDAKAESLGTEASSPSAVTEREVITTASATVEVDDVRQAAERVGTLAESVGGHVESMSVGSTAGTGELQPLSDTMTLPASAEAWVTVRVPADQLSAVMDELAGIGDVSASRIDRTDVTTATVDLRARVGSLETSVARLNELMAGAQSTADLIAAESALAERQAELESYRQQLAYLEDQVAESSLTVSLVPETEHVQADPAGFGDGLVAGWNGLIATLNGIVVALGFLLPWIGVLAVVGLVLWAVRRTVRLRRARRGSSPRDDLSGSERE
ncbi:DUF4349 domain-containing protein [Microbacterium sp.]|uniref:DUF4349 domain-containing protein n=1 Tax=Microbacterium sp. TaxID=51671 RepID=UPI0039E6BACB